VYVARQFGFESGDQSAIFLDEVHRRTLTIGRR
jgi:hypothetical protein